MSHRPRLGILGVQGDKEDARVTLADTDIKLLHNELVALPTWSKLHVLGLGPLESRERLTDSQRAGIRAFDGLTIVLGHSPDFARSVLAGRDDVPALLVAGHTHGGQVVIRLRPAGHDVRGSAPGGGRRPVPAGQRASAGESRRGRGARLRPSAAAVLPAELVVIELFPPGATVTARTAAMPSMRNRSALWRSLRPHQWVKNLFVAAPLVLSRNLMDAGCILRALAAFAVFCALSGAVYLFNDLRDVELDRAHPTKRHRPIAAGLVTARRALLVAVGLALAALLASALVSWQLAATAAAYLIINVAYSMGLKHVAYVDVGLIVAGFLLRIAGGSIGIGVPVSGWLLACTALLSAMLALGKRTHELRLAMRADLDAARTRTALAGYRTSGHLLPWLVAALSALTIGAYAVYARQIETIAAVGSDQLLWTVPYCAIGVIRFLQLSLWSRGPDAPTEVMLRDTPFLVNAALWAATVVTIFDVQPAP